MLKEKYTSFAASELTFTAEIRRSSLRMFGTFCPDYVLSATFFSSKFVTAVQRKLLVTGDKCAIWYYSSILDFSTPSGLIRTYLIAFCDSLQLYAFAILVIVTCLNVDKMNHCFRSSSSLVFYHVLYLAVSSSCNTVTWTFL
jgi:hypothetical protein